MILFILLITMFHVGPYVAFRTHHEIKTYQAPGMILYYIIYIYIYSSAFRKPIWS